MGLKQVHIVHQKPTSSPKLTLSMAIAVKSTEDMEGSTTSLQPNVQSSIVFYGRGRGTPYSLWFSTDLLGHQCAKQKGTRYLGGIRCRKPKPISIVSFHALTSHIGTIHCKINRSKVIPS